jgi:hypothetical protein
MKSAIVILFSLTSFLASVLLFSAGADDRQDGLAPFRGTPAVWNTRLVFFQVMLLLGYALSGVCGGRADDQRRVAVPF